MAKKKQIAKSDVTGDRGIAFIHRVVSDMEHIWTPKPLEAGIDGFIELRNSDNSEVAARVLQVQSKRGQVIFEVRLMSSLLSTATRQISIIGWVPIHP